MGMFDYVRLECEVPGLQGLTEEFQTKSLDPCMAHYTITKSGRLVRSSRDFGLFWDVEPSEPLTPEEMVDMDFHGDMRMVTTQGGFKEYVVRFTHGTLEWVRPVEEIPEPKRNFGY